MGAETMLDRIVAIRVAETTSSQEVDQMDEAVRRAVVEWDRIRLLVDVEGFRHMDPEGLLGKLRFLPAHGGRIERMAVVCRRVWMVVEDLSLRGARLRIFIPGHVELNEVLVVRFTLDDVMETPLIKSVMVKNMKNNEVGVAFFDPQPDPILESYLQGVAV